MPEPKLPERYKLLEELGSGGMGTVYKVFDSVLDKVFALKVLRFNATTNPNEALRFQKEAKAAGNLDHKNVMKVIDFGISEEETPYMVLEYVEGKTLKDLIREDGPMPLSVAVPVMSQIVEALECAHAQDVIHRDLKSHNIMVYFDSENQPHVKLYDFGIAKVGSDSIALTAPQAVLGTPAYMSPEQAQGGRVDHRTDIYSFGCVAFELLTGELPFNAEGSLELLDQQINKPAPLIGTIVPHLSGHPLEEMVERCLEKRAQNRYQSASDLSLAMTDAARPRELSIDSRPLALTKSKPAPITIIFAAIIFILLFCAPFFLLFGFANIAPKEPTVEETPIAPAPALETSLEREKELDPRYHIYGNTLELQQSRFADDVLAKIDPNKVKIKKVLLDNASITDKGLLSLSRLDDVKEIQAESLSGVTAGGIKQLAKIANLEDMQLKEFLVPDPGFDAIGELKNLRKFRGTDFDEHKFQVMAKLTKLQSFRVANVTVNRRCLEALCNLKKLHTIDFANCTELEPASLDLLSKFPNLVHFEIHENPNFKKHKDNPLKHIAKLKNLDELGLDDNDLTNEDIDFIKSLPRLTVLKLSGNRRLSDAALEKLREMNLRKLFIDNCDGIHEGAIEKFQLLHPDCKIFHDNKSEFREEVKGYADGLPKTP